MGSEGDLEGRKFLDAVLVAYFLLCIAVDGGDLDDASELLCVRVCDHDASNSAVAKPSSPCSCPRSYQWGGWVVAGICDVIALVSVGLEKAENTRPFLLGRCSP